MRRSLARRAGPRPRLVDRAGPIDSMLEEPVGRSRACRPKEDVAVLERHHGVKPRLAGTARVLLPPQKHRIADRVDRHVRVLDLRTCVEGCWHRSRRSRARVWRAAGPTCASRPVPAALCTTAATVLCPQVVLTMLRPQVGVGRPSSPPILTLRSSYRHDLDGTLRRARRRSPACEEVKPFLEPCHCRTSRFQERAETVRAHTLPSARAKSC